MSLFEGGTEKANTRVGAECCHRGWRSCDCGADYLSLRGCRVTITLRFYFCNTRDPITSIPVQLFPVSLHPGYPDQLNKEAAGRVIVPRSGFALARTCTSRRIGPVAPSRRRFPSGSGAGAWPVSPRQAFGMDRRWQPLVGRKLGKVPVPSYEDRHDSTQGARCGLCSLYAKCDTAASRKQPCTRRNWPVAFAFSCPREAVFRDKARKTAAQ